MSKYSKKRPNLTTGLAGSVLPATVFTMLCMLSDTYLKTRKKIFCTFKRE